MTELERWLDDRRPAPPPALRAAIDRQLALAPASGSIPETLAGAGLEALRAVLAGPGDRSAAVQLLAADALLTYACEAAAEADGDALERLTRAYGPHRFEALLTAS